MNEKSEKILTQEQVKKFGLGKVSVITTDMLEGYTSIGDCAFKGCKRLTSVTIPDSVTSIGECAFYGCTGLTSLVIPDSVTSIGIMVFKNCTGLTSVTIGNSVETIGNMAFENCSGLTSVTIPNSVTSIGNMAFENCSGLDSVTIPDSVTSIGEWAFENCICLTSVTIPNSVTSIGIMVFENCKKLTTVTIGDKTYKAEKVKDGKCKAYKGFKADMTCRDFQYEEGKTYEFDGEPMLCERGFHASLILPDVFNYYCGKIGKSIVVYEVELEGVSNKRNEFDSKVVAKKITIGKRIL